MISRSIVALPFALIALGLYLVLTGDVINSFAAFHVFDLLLVAAAFTLVVVSKRCSDAGWPIRSRIALAMSGLLTSLAILDEAILMFRYDTTGVSLYSVTLQNWNNTFVTKNRDGFWERDFETAAAGRGADLLIAVVGDSFTYGFGVKGKEKRFSDRVEQGLRRLPNHRQATVLNLGWPGANTTNEQEVVVKFGARLAPDLILICYLANDIKEAKIMRRRSVSISRFEHVISRIPALGFLYLKTIGTYRYGADGMSYFANLAFAYNDKEAFEAHLQEVRDIVSAVKTTGARPVFVMLPFPHFWAVVEPGLRQRTYASLRRTAADAGAFVIDLTSLEDEITPENFQMNPADAHPNETVHGIMADRILKELVPYLSEDRPSPGPQ